jgi:hypothetical protein
MIRSIAAALAAFALLSFAAKADEPAKAETKKAEAKEEKAEKKAEKKEKKAEKAEEKK